MRQIKDNDGQLRSLHLGDITIDFEDDVRNLDSIDDSEYELLTSQYAYIKFGLILEKVRNQCWWQKCSEKFSDFRSFCQSKVNLNIWQVSNAIKSARVAMQLVWMGFTDLPRNASQALKLADLSIERLGEVWGNILAKHQAHKITASAIESEIDPDKQAKSENIRLPRHVAEALRGQAIAAGMTLGEYLELLADPMGEDRPEDEATAATVELNQEQLAIIDRVEYQWLKPKSEKIIDTVDRLMNGLVGCFIPKVRVANE
jgi:hypothetical protein